MSTHRIQMALAIVFLTFLILTMTGVPRPALGDGKSDSLHSDLPPSSSKEEAAQIGMKVLPEIVTAETAELLGFESYKDAEVAEIDLESPWIIYTLPITGLEPEKPSAQLQKTPMIAYPITVNGMVRSSLTVAYSEKDHTWTTRGWGRAGIMQKLTKYKLSPSSIMVRVPEFNLHFVGERKEGQLILIPINDVPQFQFTAGKQLSAQEVVKSLSLAAKKGKPAEPNKPKKPA